MHISLLLLQTCGLLKKADALGEGRRKEK